MRMLGKAFGNEYCDYGCCSKFPKNTKKNKRMVRKIQRAREKREFDKLSRTW